MKEKQSSNPGQDSAAENKQNRKRQKQAEKVSIKWQFFQSEKYGIHPVRETTTVYVPGTRRVRLSKKRRCREGNFLGASTLTAKHETAELSESQPKNNVK